MNVDVGGTTAGTQFNQLVITGTAMLAGTLNIGLLDGYAPANGSTFPILTAGSLTGTFATINGPTAGPAFMAGYSSAGVVISPAPQPELNAAADSTSVDSTASTIVVGDHYLRPGASGQTVQILVSGGTAVQGENVDVQIAGTSGTGNAPTITGVDLLTGTIFANDNTGEQSAAQTLPQFWNGSVVTSTGTVSANGLLATVTVDATGVALGSAYSLNLAGTPNGDTDFAGIPANVTNGHLFVSYYGDANLDGKVDFNDLVILARHFGMSGATWANGDFDGDGKVDFNDLVLLARNYGHTVPQPAGAALAQDLSAEPLSLVLRHRRRVVG